jgi:hypothetical protein
MTSVLNAICISCLPFYLFICFITSYFPYMCIFILCPSVSSSSTFHCCAFPSHLSCRPSPLFITMANSVSVHSDKMNLTGAEVPVHVECKYLHQSRDTTTDSITFLISLRPYKFNTAQFPQSRKHMPVYILVFGRLVAGVGGSNPAEGMHVCLLCFYVVLSCAGRGL